VQSLLASSFYDSFVSELPGDARSDPRPRQVAGVSYSFVSVTAVSTPDLLAYSAPLCQELGLAPLQVGPGADADVLTGNRLLSGMKPYASCYGGHQFGHWAGQLGDGRAISLGEYRDPVGKTWEFQLKGAGLTAYSRRGDGRAVLRSSLREFICSEAMYHLGVPTTRALSLALTGDQVLRDMFYDGHAAYEAGAIVCRVAPSFIRFGNFEIHHVRRETDILKRLADYVIAAHYPHLDAQDPKVYQQWFSEIAARTALMVAHWMRVGFVHGVMNTDNMSVLGLTIDYGPYGWMDVYDPDWTPNTTDAATRRYRFGNQAQVAQWNLEKLGTALGPLFVDDDAIDHGLEFYRKSFEGHYSEMMRNKLGLRERTPYAMRQILSGLDRTLRAQETDMTLFFRLLARIDAATSVEAGVQILTEAFYDSTASAAVQDFLRQYSQILQDDRLPSEERRDLMRRSNPKYIPRNYLAQEAIDAVMQGDRTVLQRLLKMIEQPYAEQDEYADLSAKRPEWARHKAGCSALSCSS